MLEDFLYMEFCIHACSLYLEKDIGCLERVQKRATKTVQLARLEGSEVREQAEEVISPLFRKTKTPRKSDRDIQDISK